MCKLSRFRHVFVIAVLGIVYPMLVSTANAAHFSINYSGTFDRDAYSNLESFIEVNDQHSGHLTFDLAADGTLSNIAGSATLGDHDVTFTGDYRTEALFVPGGLYVGFKFNALSDGNGAYVDTLLLRFNPVVGTASYDLYALLMNSTVEVNELSVSGRVPRPAGGTFAGFIYDDDPTAQINVSVVPLPAALPLYGAGLVIVGLVGRRYKKRLSAS